MVQQRKAQQSDAPVSTPRRLSSASTSNRKKQYTVPDPLSGKLCCDQQWGCSCSWNFDMCLMFLYWWEQRWNVLLLFPVSAVVIREWSLWIIKIGLVDRRFSLVHGGLSWPHFVIIRNSCVLQHDTSCYSLQTGISDILYLSQLTEGLMWGVSGRRMGGVWVFAASCVVSPRDSWSPQQWAGERGLVCSAAGCKA